MPFKDKATRQAYERRPEVIARRQTENRKYARFHSLKSSTGWTEDARAAALVAQGGRCAICPRELGDGVQCDHDHATKKPRKLLCRACNLGLGYYEKWQRPAGLSIEPYDIYLASV